MNLVHLLWKQDICLFLVKRRTLGVAGAYLVQESVLVLGFLHEAVHDGCKLSQVPCALQLKQALPDHTSRQAQRQAQLTQVQGHSRAQFQTQQPGNFPDQLCQGHKT